MQQKIIRLKNHEIDPLKWDACVTASKNASVYGEHWLLTVASPGWQALVMGDYDAVFPLTVYSKAKLKFIAQPLFVQQLGIFSKTDLTTEIINAFYRSIPFPVLTMQTFSKYEIPKKYRQALRPNYILSLNSDYKTLRSNYSTNCKRNLKKADNFNTIHTQSTNVDRFIGFSARHSNFTNKNSYWVQLEKITTASIAKGSGMIHEINSPDEKLLSAGLFLKNSQRIIFLSGSSSPEGFKNRSMFLLIDQVIRQNAGSDILLDFGGSAIENISRFYKSFGSINHPYYVYQHKLLKFL